MTSSNLILGIVLALAAAVVPTIFYVLLVRWIDRYEREPAALLAGAFLWGAVPAVIGALILEVLVGVPLSAFGSSLLVEITEASGVAPIVEETIKALGLVGLLLLFAGEFDDTLDGVVYGALVGFGFGMTENFVYFIGSFGQGGLERLAQTIVLRVGVFGFTHAFFTSMTGAGLGYARSHDFRRRSWIVALLGLGAAMGFHALHNLGASLAGQVAGGILLSLVNITVGLILLLVIIFWSLAQERRWIAQELKDEVGASITRGEYELLTRKRALLAKKAGPLACVAGRRVNLLAELSRLATELAFKKYQARLGDAGATQAVEDLRRRIGEVRHAAAPLAPRAGRA